MKTVSAETKKESTRFNYEPKEIVNFLTTFWISISIPFCLTKLFVFALGVLGVSEGFLDYAGLFLLVAFGFVTFKYKLGSKLFKRLESFVFRR